MVPAPAPAAARGTLANPGHRPIAKGVEVGTRPAAHGATMALQANVAETAPDAWQVSFMELALDFEAFARRPLPLAPQSKFPGGDMSFQDKGRVLRLIVTLLGRAIEQESIFPAKKTHHCRYLTSMGASTTMGLEGRPIFTRPTAVWNHLERLRLRGSKSRGHAPQSAMPRLGAKPRNQLRSRQQDKPARRKSAAQRREGRKAHCATMRPTSMLS